MKEKLLLPISTGASSWNVEACVERAEAWDETEGFSSSVAVLQQEISMQRKEKYTQRQSIQTMRVCISVSKWCPDLLFLLLDASKELNLVGWT